MSNCFRWLHLTDFHWGSPVNKDFWGQVAPAFYDDLKLLKNNCGGDWDVIFFTGDLVNHGKKEEYEELNEILKAIKKKLECDPVFICVPGNHDLTRPDSNASECYAMKDSWFKAKNHLRENFWNKKNTDDYHNKIKSYFSNYTTWAETQTHGFRKPETDKFKPGLMPGDFSYTYEKPGTDIKVGVVGLNSTFLQITEDNYNKKLDLSVKQINEVCTKMPDDWINTHDMSILLTHQPSEWFHAKSDFIAIAPPNRIDLHLCGHLHLNQSSSVKKGGAQHSVNVVQARALFSKEKTKKYGGNGASDQDRLHGYCAGKAEFKGKDFEMRFWPRIGGINKDSRVFSFKRDNSQDLRESDGGTEPLILKRRRLGPIIIAPPADPPKKETLSDYEIFIKEKVKEELLKDKLLSGFVEALFKIIKEDCGDFKSSETEELASFLVRTYILESISLVSRSLNKYLMIYSHKEEKDRQTIWEHAYSIVGWLVTLAVDQKLITQFDNNKESPENHNLSDIPTMAFSANGTLEIVFSNFKKTRAEFDLTTESNGDYKITGNKGKCLDPCINIESGILVDNKLNELKSELWERVKFSKEPSKESFTNDETTILLARLVARANEKTHYFYLFFTDKIKLDQVNSAALLKLRKEFNTLTIMQIKLAEENTKLIAVPERELEQQLIVFLHKKEDFIAGHL